MGKIEMECGVGHAAHPGQLSRAHLEYINKHDELRGDKPRHRGASFLILRPHRSRIPNAFPVRRSGT